MLDQQFKQTELCSHGGCFIIDGSGIRWNFGTWSDFFLHHFSCNIASDVGCLCGRPEGSCQISDAGSPTNSSSAVHGKLKTGAAVRLSV